MSEFHLEFFNSQGDKSAHAGYELSQNTLSIRSFQLIVLGFLCLLYLDY